MPAENYYFLYNICNWEFVVNAVFTIPSMRQINGTLLSPTKNLSLDLHDSYNTSERRLGLGVF